MQVKKTRGAAAEPALTKKRRHKMSAENKRREVLQMLAKGAINAQEAGDLLVQIEEQSATATSPPTPEPAAQAVDAAAKAPETSRVRRPARWLNVKVASLADGEDRVAVKIPLKLARVGLRLGARFSPEMQDIDWDEILDQIDGGDMETLVEVRDKEDGDLVQIFVS
jgi:hypothetical protein